jgi:TP901 family phage tail tape measure protein
MRAFNAVTRGVTDVITGSIRASSEFNDAFTKSTAIMGDLSQTMRTEMVRAAEEVAKTTTFSAKEAAEAYFFLASAGLDAVQSVKALPQVSKFAQAGAFDLAQATDLLTDAQSALGMTIRGDVIKNMENMARVSDVLVKANTLANASVEQFSQALTSKAGAALKILGKDIEEGVAVLAAFADQGVKAQEAGTALNIVLRDLSTKAIDNADAFARNKVAVFDAGGEMNNIASIVSDLEDRLAGMSDEMAKATLKELGFADKSVIFIQTLIGMSDRIREYEEELRKAGGTTELIAGKQMESFAAQVKVVQNHWEILLKTLGDFITQGKIGKEILKILIDVLIRMTDSLIRNREQWIRLVGGGIDLALGGMDAFLTVTGLMIGGLAKLGKALLWVGDLLPQTQPESWIRSQRAMVEQLEAFGEGLLRGAAEVDLLQERLQFATKVQLDNAEAQKKASAQTLEFRKALTDLRGSLDTVETGTNNANKQVQQLVIGFGEFSLPIQSATDSIGEFAKELEKPIAKAKTFAQLNKEAMDKASRLYADYGPKLSDLTDGQEELNEETDNFNKILQQSQNLVIIFGRSIGGLVASLASAASGFKSLFGKPGGGFGFGELFKGFKVAEGEKMGQVRHLALLLQGSQMPFPQSAHSPARSWPSSASSSSPSGKS